MTSSSLTLEKRFCIRSCSAFQPYREVWIQKGFYLHNIFGYLVNIVTPEIITTPTTPMLLVQNDLRQTEEGRINMQKRIRFQKGYSVPRHGVRSKVRAPFEKATIFIFQTFFRCVLKNDERINIHSFITIFD